MIFRFDCEKGLEFHTLHHARHGHVSVLLMYSRCFSERAVVLSAQTHLDERRTRFTAALVWHNDQFEHSDIDQFHSIVLDLADCSG